jgi:hypothetical protein
MEAICSPKRRSVSELHGDTVEKSGLFILTAMRISNPTRCVIKHHVMEV